METIRVTVPARRLGNQAQPDPHASLHWRAGRGAGSDAGRRPRGGDAHAPPHQRAERLLRHRRRIRPAQDLRQPASGHPDRCDPARIDPGGDRRARPGDDRETAGPRLSALAASIFGHDGRGGRPGCHSGGGSAAAGGGSGARRTERRIRWRHRSGQPGTAAPSVRPAKQQGVPRLEAPAPTAAIPRRSRRLRAGAAPSARRRATCRPRRRPRRRCSCWRPCCSAGAAWRSDRRAWQGACWRTSATALVGADAADGSEQILPAGGIGAAARASCR